MGAFDQQPGEPGIYRFPKLYCPTCGHYLDAVAASSDGAPLRAPNDGDFGVCVECLAPHVYQVSKLGVGIRALHPLEFAQLQPEIHRNIEILRELRRRPETD
jgi:hypothetical protein